MLKVGCDCQEVLWGQTKDYVGTELSAFKCFWHVQLLASCRTWRTRRCFFFTGLVASLTASWQNSWNALFFSSTKMLLNSQSRRIPSEMFNNFHVTVKYLKSSLWKPKNPSHICTNRTSTHALMLGEMTEWEGCHGISSWWLGALLRGTWSVPGGWTGTSPCWVVRGRLELASLWFHKPKPYKQSYCCVLKLT